MVKDLLVSLLETLTLTSEWTLLLYRHECFTGNYIITQVILAF